MCFPDQRPCDHHGCRAGVCHPTQHDRKTALWPGEHEWHVWNTDLYIKNYGLQQTCSSSFFELEASHLAFLNSASCVRMCESPFPPQTTSSSVISVRNTTEKINPAYLPISCEIIVVTGRNCKLIFSKYLCPRRGSSCLRIHRLLCAFSFGRRSADELFVV